jgi:DNA-binding response OmpR family regulator
VNETGAILIIDDEASLRQTLARILQRAGFTVTTAAGGKEAFELLRQQSFDLVYMDIRMPDINGLEALKTIHAELPDLPVILFTAQPDLHSAVDALRSGASDYLLKPLKPADIIERTRVIFAKLEREHRKKELQGQIQALQNELRNLEAAEKAEQAPAESMPDMDERYLKRGKLSLDLHARRVIVKDRIVSIPPTAFDYLLALAHHAPNIVDYQTLVAEAQGYEADMREAQELTKWHIRTIREALEPDARNPEFIINIRGKGYRLITD